MEAEVEVITMVRHEEPMAEVSNQLWPGVRLHARQYV